MCAGYVRRKIETDRVVGCVCRQRERKSKRNKDGVCICRLCEV